MDNGVPPTNKRAGSRPSGGGGTKSRARQPGDPRKEGAAPSNGSTSGSTPNGQRNAQRVGRNGDKSQQKNAKRRGADPAALMALSDPLLSVPDAAGFTLTEPPVTDSVNANGNGTAHDVTDPIDTTFDVIDTDISIADLDEPTTNGTILDEPATNGTVHADPTDFFHDTSEANGVVALVETAADSPSQPESEFESEGESESEFEFEFESQAEVDDEAVALAEAFGRVPLLLPPIVPADLDDLPPPTTDVPVILPIGEPEFTDTDGTDGLPSLNRPMKPARALRKPVVRPRRRPRVRKVTRVVRHVDTWSVFKVALVFNLFLYAVCLTAGVLLWQVAVSTGTVDNIERFFESFGWERFELKAGEIYHNSWIAGLFVVVGFTGMAVLMATMFNLITDLVGGIRVTVLEEEVVAREERGTGWRRARRQAPKVADETEHA